MTDPELAARIADMIRARGAEYERAVETRRWRKQEQERHRKSEARRRLTPEQRMRECYRKQKARAAQTPEQREQERQRKQSRKKVRPFMAIDGEGAGTDFEGRQNYLLMVAANSEETYTRHRDGERLTTRDCLEFLLSLPVEPILIGFHFTGYDANQILRGIMGTNNGSTIRRILKPNQGKYGPLSTYWGDYAITYQPGKYFRVSRLDPDTRKPIKQSCRTVYEVFGFFQCSFIDAIEKWNIGSEDERSMINQNKDRRAEFSKLTTEIVEYCTLECRHLAMLIEKFRETCTDVGIRPRDWSGAGELAAALFKKHGIPKRPPTSSEAAVQSISANPRRPERDPKFEIAANHAYYGGRFEISRTGSITGPIYQYDLHSAYPSEMRNLPCPLHTKWHHKPRAGRLPESGIYLGKVSFNHPEGLWCGFPFRGKNGGLFWPQQGTGWYWSVEIEAARRYLHAEIAVLDLWVARRECNCRLFDWVEELYNLRRELGLDTRGQPLKFGLNSLYGKQAQRSGRGPYHDAVSAGLITAATRARLIEALAQNPSAVFMLATDAVYSTRPLALDIGEGLGQWEPKVWPDLFVVQPGVYWSPSDQEKSLKSRGAKRSVIGGATRRFISTWKDLHERLRPIEFRERRLEERLFPTVPVTVRVFYGCRLAMHRNKPHLAGKWEDVERQESFEWRTKRDPMRVVVSDEGYIQTFPRTQPIFAESAGKEPANFEKSVEILDVNSGTVEIDEDMLLEAMPDFTPFLPYE
jgi:hypothetical protein